MFVLKITHDGNHVGLRMVRNRAFPTRKTEGLPRNRAPNLVLDLQKASKKLAIEHCRAVPGRRTRVVPPPESRKSSVVSPPCRALANSACQAAVRLQLVTASLAVRPLYSGQEKTEEKEKGKRKRNGSPHLSGRPQYPPKPRLMAHILLALHVLKLRSREAARHSAAGTCSRLQPKCSSAPASSACIKRWPRGTPTHGLGSTYPSRVWLQ